MNDSALLVLIGTKAQFIKMAPVLREFNKRNMSYRLIYTGQHSETFDLLEAAFGVRGADDTLVPGFEADTHRSFLTWCWCYWREVIRRLRRGSWKGMRIGLVHGDTASTLFGAIAILIAGGKVAHVEAGLRSPRLFEPFPEEIIRRMVSRMSTWHFVPDARAAANLQNAKGKVICTEGNTLRDAFALALRSIGQLPKQGGEGGYAVVSMHRNENLSHMATLDFLMEEVMAAAEQTPVKFVMHPATRAKLESSGWLDKLDRQPRLELLERMGYPDFIKLLLGSSFLMTDGGSNQEEAAMLGLPTLLLRRTTERVDGLGANVALSGLRQESIRVFVANNAGRHWRLMLDSDDVSPTVRLVDALAIEATGKVS